ncbi:MAG TPA: isochorismatase family cysteine hydrolase [Gemmatimonadales bacterium]|nr:isochorismatase family cysteine hydrolase [Gemmatimonadales bacterium]
MATALVLIDVINDFFDPVGRNYHPSYEPILANIRRVLAAARRGGIAVIHCMEGHRPGVDFEHRKLPVHCIVGEHDAEPAQGIEILDGEVVVRKRRYSAFFGTDLDLVLRERGIDRLLIVGVKSHVCIRATIQDAFGSGYEALLVRDCTGSNRPHLHEASLEDIERYMGRVISLAETLSLLGEA